MSGVSGCVSISAAGPHPWTCPGKEYVSHRMAPKLRIVRFRGNPRFDVVEAAKLTGGGACAEAGPKTRR